MSARALPARARVLVATLAALACLVCGGPLSAHADPSPQPTTDRTPTPTKDLSATPTADLPTASVTSSADPATATQTAPEPLQAPVTSTPVRSAVPTPASADLVPGSVPTRSSVQPTTPSAAVTTVRTTCSPTEDSAGSIEFVVAVGPGARASYAVLAADDGVVDAGAFRSSSSRHQVTRTVKQLAPGRYRISAVVDGASQADEVIVLVLQCVTGTVECQRVTLANPSGNPAVTVAYRDPSRDDDRARFVTVEPGQSSTVRVSFGTISWSSVVRTDIATMQAGTAADIDLAEACERGAAPVTVSGAVADTGAPAAALAVAGAAIVLLVSGLVLVFRRRSAL